jgi:hypothetical protein
MFELENGHVAGLADCCVLPEPKSYCFASRLDRWR